MQKSNIPEEETITPVIKDLERIVVRIFNTIGKGISILVEFLKTILLFIISHFKKLILVGILGGIIGYLSFYVVPKEYASNLIVKLNIDAKEQLESDIQYFNSLVKRKQIEKLADILNLTPVQAESINKFELKPFSSLKERIEYVNSISKSLDTSFQRYIDINEILNDSKSSYSNKYLITILSKDEFVFEKIETPFLAYLERVPELNEMRNSILTILENERAILVKEMESLDTLKKISNSVLVEQAKAKKNSTPSAIINLERSTENSGINPMEIYAKMIEYSKEISKIDSLRNNYKSCYIVYSHFNKIGNKVGLGALGRIVVLSLSFFIITAIYIALKGIIIRIQE